MPRHAHFVPHGVIPAVLLPFHDDLSIDEKSFRSHLRDVAQVLAEACLVDRKIVMERQDHCRDDAMRNVGFVTGHCSISSAAGG
jgi:hypothetical protein